MKALLQISLLGLLVASCAFSKNKSQEFFDKATSKAPYDVIIVPGVPHEGQSWQTVMQIRVHWANYLYKNNIAKNIIFSGGAVYSPYSEAKVMREYGLAMDIPQDRIFVDTNAEHSTENVYCSYQIAKSQGFEKIALATDPFQAKSLKNFIKRHELSVDMLPILFDTLKTMDLAEPAINPSMAYEENFVSIKEREGFFTRLSGTFGQQIIWYEEDLPSDKLIDKYDRKGRLIRTSNLVTQ